MGEAYVILPRVRLVLPEWVWVNETSRFKIVAEKKEISDERKKKESLERLIQSYHQAKTDNNTTQIKNLEAILKRLGHTKFK